MKTYNAIIVGAGPAGINSAIYISRNNINDILVFENNTSSLSGNFMIDNFYSYESISSKELYQKGIAQIKALGIDVLSETVVHIDYDYEEKTIMVTTDKGIYKTKSLVFATGKKRTKLNVKMDASLEGKGVSYCATCDGFFYRKKDVVVIGSKSFAINEYNVLKHIAGTTTLLSNGEQVDEFPDEYENRKITEICRENEKMCIVFIDGTRLYVDGIFIALGNASSTDFAKQLGIAISPNSDIIVDEFMKTNYENIYACGDSIGGTLQISKALYDGMKAGLSLSSYLRKRK